MIHSRGPWILGGRRRDINVKKALEGAGIIPPGKAPNTESRHAVDQELADMFITAANPEIIAELKAHGVVAFVKKLRLSMNWT
ncbi:uncharacterized protein F4822DRAFT_418929 [Hypoxylon trugodes]|uniref:uncharacterized protein n=1 Tax=Hypoxylon trugodes TaxID=326681 RepID=UPI00218F74A2|nr:uncharacterized protein F4822DRAFT_418929 [Hypoxylon trugodes]KAI1384181.1 hypothetical protein F4822DRAFT_418929 [Hypoxylon trugodes]